MLSYQKDNQRSIVSLFNCQTTKNTTDKTSPLCRPENESCLKLI